MHPYESGVENAPRFSNTNENSLRDTRLIAATDSRDRSAIKERLCISRPVLPNASPSTRYCDLTLAYTDTSGGIRTYIDHKRRWITENSNDEHVLIIPGEHDRASQTGQLHTIELQSPLIPGAHPYQFFWRPDKVRHALAQSAPDIVELGSFFVEPWVAFRYRDECRQHAAHCLVSAYFHTDIAHAYVGAPLRHLLVDGVEEVSETLAAWGHRVSEVIENGAEASLGQIFSRCDLTFAATAAQAARIAEYGVSGTEIVPLGVDLAQFSPEQRSTEWRQLQA